jgi:hypothetical protein
MWRAVHIRKVIIIYLPQAANYSLTFMLGNLFYPIILKFVGRESAVGLATRYGMDGPGIESQ